jgi:hypothetical protein
MLVLNEKTYSKEYVAKAIEAFAKTQEGQRDTYRDRESALGLQYRTPWGMVVVKATGGEYHSLLVDLAANAEQKALLHSKTNFPILPIAEIDFPNAGTDSPFPDYKTGKVENCPQLYLYENFGNDASHVVLMDGNGILIREV